MPAPAMKPIMLVAVKNEPDQRVGRQDADERERDGDQDHERHREALEPADHEDVDEQEHRGEGEAEVAEHLERDVPLAVPLEGGGLGAAPGGRGRGAAPPRRRVAAQAREPAPRARAARRRGSRSPRRARRSRTRRHFRFLWWTLGLDPRLLHGDELGERHRGPRAPGTVSASSVSRRARCAGASWSTTGTWPRPALHVEGAERRAVRPPRRGSGRRARAGRPAAPPSPGRPGARAGARSG